MRAFTIKRSALTLVICAAAVMAVETQAATNRPDGYKTLCNLDETCSVSQATNVAFGAAGKFVYKVLNGKFSCTTATFGSDPIPDKTSKECSIPNSGTGISSSSAKSSAVSSVKSSASSIKSSSSSVKSSSSAIKSSVASSKSSAASSKASSSTASAPLLSQEGNPISTVLNNYKTWLSTNSDSAAKLTADKVFANNMITWQMPHGGFYKNSASVYSKAWDGKAERSGWTGENDVELGTIDNNATVSELLFLADVYQRSGDTKYRDAARKALDFILTMQYSTGGWPQVYPKRTGVIYSNYVTFNDDAMVRVLLLLDQLQKQTTPLNGDLFTSEQRSKVGTAIAGGVDFILKSQIVQNKAKTVWCAQHDPASYVPRPARAFELESKSGKESVLVTAFLMSRPQTPAVTDAVKGALAWFRNPAVQVKNTAYVNRPSGSTDDKYNPIQSKSGSTMWYRFYDLEADTGFFSGRLPTDNPPGTGKQYDLMQVEPERRYGYSWGGSYATKLLDYAQTVGY